MTTPALVTVAIALLLLDQLPLVEGVTLAVEPTQSDEEPPMTGFAGIALTTTFAEAEEVHKLLLVTVKV